VVSRRKIDVSEERRILAQMIMSTGFLAKLKDIADPKLFKSPYSQTVARWVWEFYEHTSEAPQRAIEDVYLKNRHTVHSEEDNELIAEFLKNLSEDWEKLSSKNIKYSVKTATEFFRLRSIEILKEQLDDEVTAKNPQAAEKLVAEYRRVDKPRGSGLSLLRNPQLVRAAFTVDHEYLFRYPKVWGEVVGTFKRGDFFGIMGPPKRGKSWYLLYTAIRAVLMGFKVVLYSLEMNEDPVIRRAWRGFTGLSERGGKVKIPIFVESDDEKKEWDVSSKSVKKKVLDLEAVEKDQNRYLRASRGGELRIHTFPAYSASVQDLEDHLTNLEYYDGFVADVIITDYADLFRAESNRMDYRHQLDNIWKGHRGMAQRREALVVTGTQTGRIAMERDAKASDVAEDMRKVAHVTGMMILNQNEREREAGVMRITVTAQREEKAFTREIVVLQQLEIGRPYIDCRLADTVNLSPFEVKKK